MKLFKIIALILCLNVPMAHANDDTSSCMSSLKMLTVSASVTGVAATQVYNDYHKHRRVDPSAVLWLATFAGFTILTAGCTYQNCGQNNCTLNK
jgi:hypothetical protein